MSTSELESVTLRVPGAEDRYGYLMGIAGIYDFVWIHVTALQQGKHRKDLPESKQFYYLAHPEHVIILDSNS